MALATSAFLAGDADAAVRAWQHGYQELVQAGDGLGAARCAFWIGLVLGLRGEQAVAAGWAARAQRMLETEPEDIVERGYLLIHEFYAHLGRGDLARAEETGAEVARVGRRFGDPDLVAQGLVSMGRIAIYRGRVREGLALLDEAMVGITAGEVSPVFAGLVYCTVIEGCQELADFSRMSSWTRGPDPVVRGPARPGSLHRAVLTAPRPDPPPARSLRRRPGRVQPGPAPSRDRLPAVRRGGRGAARAR